MGKAVVTEQTQDGIYVMLFFGLIGYPLLIFALVVYAYPASEGWLRAGVIAATVFFVVADLFFISWFLPRRPIARFRKQDGAFRVPPRRLMGLLVAAMVFPFLVIAPIGAPALLVAMVWAILFDPGKIVPVLDEWSFRNLYESVDTLLGLPAFIALLFFTPVLLPGLFKAYRRQLGVLGVRYALVIDDDGLTIWTPDPVVIPWPSITDATLFNYNSIWLTGDDRLAPLVAKVHKRLPQEYRPQEVEGKALISFELLPVSASSVVALIEQRIS